MKIYMDLQKINKISHFVENICVFEESHYQEQMEAVTRHCRETEQNDSVFIFTTEKSNMSHFNEKEKERVKF